MAKSHAEREGESYLLLCRRKLTRNTHARKAPKNPSSPRGAVSTQCFDVLLTRNPKYYMRAFMVWLRRGEPAVLKI